MADEFLDRRSEERRQLDHLTHEVNALKSKVDILQLEQGHLVKLFEAKFSGLDSNVKLGISKIETLADKFTGLISEPDGSPMGRNLNLRANENRKDIDELLTWKSSVEGGVWLLRLMTIPGIIACASWLFKLLIKNP